MGRGDTTVNSELVCLSRVLLMISLNHRECLDIYNEQYYNNIKIIFKYNHVLFSHGPSVDIIFDAANKTIRRPTLTLNSSRDLLLLWTLCDTSSSWSTFTTVGRRSFKRAIADQESRQKT
jgi:hypothetical protein